MPFPTTRWTLVVRAADGAADALSALMQTYWLPLYVYARRSGCDRPGAEDAVQDFLAHVVERQVLARADATKGRLRAFLKTAFRNHLNDARAKGAAQKRGGGLRAVDLDDAEVFLARAGPDPERAFDKQWAQLVMARALAALADDFAESYELVKKYFDGDVSGDYERIAKERGVSVATVKSLLHRARGKYREHLRTIVRDTVDAQTETDGELDELMRALA
ncbi:MAG: sigma-70 family RNA polymerase sigma factor [Deltaproteobacteria bacterium]|nr:sigma-70 family RNA polymerase sigma factor [Deltaproteobacteria bacterium]